MKCGNCQTKRMAKSAMPGHSMMPRAAVQPIAAEGSGEGADKGVERGDPLERRVDGDVANGGEEREGSGEEVGCVREVERAEEGGCEAEDEAVGERDASCGHRAVHCAAHQGVGLAFEGLIERAGAAGDDGDSKEGLQHAGLEGADAALEAAEVVACSGGDDDHQGDPDFEERGVVADQRMGSRMGSRGRGCDRLSRRWPQSLGYRLCHRYDAWGRVVDAIRPTLREARRPLRLADRRISAADA